MNTLKINMVEGLKELVADVSEPITLPDSPTDTDTNFPGWFKFTHKAGINSTKVSGGENIKWILCNGTLLENVDNLLGVELTSGTSYVYCSNWEEVDFTLDTTSDYDMFKLPPLNRGLKLKGLEDEDFSMEKIPPVLESLSFIDVIGVDSNISDIPRVTKILEIVGEGTMNGLLTDLPNVSHTLNLTGIDINATSVDGVTSLAQLPRVSNTLCVTELSGDLTDLPPVSHKLRIDTGSYRNWSDYLTGKISDIPNVTNYLYLNGCKGITGDIKDLPEVENYLALCISSSITGDLSTLPKCPYGLLSFRDCSNVTGALTNINPDLALIDLWGVGMTSDDIDQTIINLRNTTNVTSGGILIFSPFDERRTSASDEAYDYLTANGWDIPYYTDVSITD